jgi:hypothetical protein
MHPNHGNPLILTVLGFGFLVIAVVKPSYAADPTDPIA